MAIKNISFASKLPTIKNNQAILVGIQSVDKTLKVLSHSEHPELTPELLRRLGVSANPENLTKAIIANRLYLMVGIATQYTANDLREAMGAGVRASGDQAELVVDLPFASQVELRAATEGALLADYSFDLFKGSTPSVSKLNALKMVSPHRLTRKTLDELTISSAAISQARDLINTPPNVLYPETFAAEIKKLAKGTGATVEIWDVPKLKQEKCIGILSVGKGSVRTPRLIKIEYRPKGASKHLALVGKGITFDSGGLTLKPGLGMLGMKYDMAGAATVGLAAIAIAKLGLPVRVTAYLCVAENLPSGSATRPNDVIKYRNGKTVEVTNTDAEGRLVLADGLILASEQRPDLIVDVATLTGAARVALGVRTAGLMGTENGVQKLQSAAATSGEALWAMPLPKELRSQLNSDIADMINSKLGDASGGMLVGGHFLKEFIGPKVKGGTEILDWAHLDIAGPANNDGAPYGHTPKGATGVMLRTLVEVAKSL